MNKVQCDRCGPECCYDFKDMYVKDGSGRIYNIKRVDGKWFFEVDGEGSEEWVPEEDCNRYVEEAYQEYISELLEKEVLGGR